MTISQGRLNNKTSFVFEVDIMASIVNSCETWLYCYASLRWRAFTHKILTCKNTAALFSPFFKTIRLIIMYRKTRGTTNN